MELTLLFLTESIVSNAKCHLLTEPVEMHANNCLTKKKNKEYLKYNELQILNDLLILRDNIKEPGNHL